MTTLPRSPASTHRTSSSYPSPAIPSSPPPQISKPRAKPTVTPRSFRRFFAPRTSQDQLPSQSAGRNALNDITGAGGNRYYRGGKRRSPKKDSIRLFDEDENPALGSNNLRSRKRSICSRDSTPERSSPLKRFKRPSLEPDFVFGCLSETEEVEKGPKSNSVPLPKHVVRSNYRACLGHTSRRELGLPAESFRKPPGNFHPDWRSQVANFYTGPQDCHVSRNFTAVKPDFALPFCTAACNTNSLVAVGDEEGGVRLLETESNGKTVFKKPFLSFRPHINAILDLAFSTDDSLLATASGDQSGQVIDMRTQQTVYSMRGHISSVKQILFQPGGTGDVLATSSRDGSIQIWDLRCKGAAAPVSEFKVNIGGKDDSQPTTLTFGSKPRNAACVKLIREAHAAIWHNGDPPSIVLRAPNSRRVAIQARNEVSITALSFVSPKTPHLLLSGSEANATVKLWDLRMKQYSQSRSPVPLSTTREPDAHGRHREFGLTSMAISGDASRLYTLCKDSTVYTYSTNHLILGSAPELQPDRKPRRSGENKEGMGPLYAFRHPKLKASTFYVKAAIRPMKGDGAEVLAVGSSDSCAVLFPTDERCLKDQKTSPIALQIGDAPVTPTLTQSSSRRPSLSRSSSGIAPVNRFHDTIPVYQHGAALVGGHDKEVTSLTWGSDGELVTVGDDWKCRVWREDSDKARGLRQNGEAGGNRWGHGWADIGSLDNGWDDEEC